MTRRQPISRFLRMTINPSPKLVRVFGQGGEKVPERINWRTGRPACAVSATALHQENAGRRLRAIGSVSASDTSRLSWARCSRISPDLNQLESQDQQSPGQRGVLSNG